MPENGPQIDQIMQSVKEEAEKISLESVSKETIKDFADIKSNLEAVKELKESIPSINNDIKNMNQEWTANFKSVKQVSDILNKIPSVVSQVKAVQASHNTSLKDSISLMMKELELLDKKNKLQRDTYSILDKLQQNQIKKEEQILAKINERISAKKREIKEEESMQKMVQKTVFQQGLLKKGSILGSVAGHLDTKSLSSLLIGKLFEGTGIQKALQNIGGFEGGTSKRKELRKLEEIADATNRSLKYEDEGIKTQREESRERKRYSKVGAIGLGAVAAGALATKGAVDVGGKVASTAIQGLNTAWSGPGGVMKAFTDPIVAGLKKISPNLGGAAGGLIESIIKTILFEKESELMSAQTSLVGARQGGTPSLNVMGQAGNLTREEYMNIVAQSTRAGLTIKGGSAGNAQVGDLAGYQKLYGEDFIANISAMNTGVGNVEEATRRAVNIFESLRSVAGETGISVEQLAAATASAAEKARFLNIDYRLVRNTMASMVKDTKSLQMAGVDVKNRGGDIASGIIGARKSMSLAAAMYYGTRMNPGMDVQDAATMMRYGDPNAININAQGRLTTPLNPDELARRSTGLTVDLVKNIQQQAGELSASGMKGATLIEKLSQSELGAGLTQEQLITALKLDPKDLKQEFLDSLNQSWMDPKKALQQTASMAAKTVAIQGGISKIVMSILSNLIALPRYLQALVSGEDTARFDAFYEKTAKEGELGAKMIGDVMGSLKTSSLAAALRLYDLTPEEKKAQAEQEAKDIKSGVRPLGGEAQWKSWSKEKKYNYIGDSLQMSKEELQKKYAPEGEQLPPPQSFNWQGPTVNPMPSTGSKGTGSKVQSTAMGGGNTTIININGSLITDQHLRELNNVVQKSQKFGVS